jgi:hypothetical protein
MLAWNKDVPAWFQQNAWIDGGDAMSFIAKGFVEHKHENHGDLPVLLVCDKTSNHI